MVIRSRLAVSAGVLGFVLGCGLAAAEETPLASFHEQMFLPELILQHREELELTAEQIERIRGHIRGATTDAVQAEKRVEPETRRLSGLLAAENVDESAALAQLDKMLDAEREVKRVHLRVLIRIRNELTTEQRGILAAKQKQAPRPDELQRRLRAKLSRIQKEVQRRARAGQPPAEVLRLMPSFEKEMKAGRPEAAEAVLDRILKLLDLRASSRPRGRPKIEPDSGAARLDAAPAALGRVPVSKPLSPETVGRQVEGLKEQDVAWRKIAWETCLVDGLKKSRDQKKPLILWIFIDRPIDDERC